MWLLWFWSRPIYRLFPYTGFALTGMSVLWTCMKISLLNKAFPRTEAAAIFRVPAHRNSVCNRKVLPPARSVKVFSDFFRSYSQYQVAAKIRPNLSFKKNCDVTQPVQSYENLLALHVSASKFGPSVQFLSSAACSNSLPSPYLPHFSGHQPTFVRRTSGCCVGTFWNSKFLSLPVVSVMSVRAPN